MKLHELHDNPGAARKQKRVARGPGSGKGKTAGRGIKGQKSRSGVAIGGYEGGQMPLYRRLPKRGFNKPNAKSYAVVNLGMIQKFIAEGKLDAAQPITAEAMVASGLIRREMFPGDLLGGHAMPGVVPLNLLGGRDRILKRNKRNEAFPDGEPLGPAGLLQQNRSAEG